MSEAIQGLEFYEGSAIRESAAVQKENLLTKEYLRELYASPDPMSRYDEIRILEWFLEYLHENPVHLNYKFNLQWITEILDWAGYERKPAYPMHNWIKGMNFSACAGGYLRHMKAHHAGELLDEQSGKPHIAHASCNLYFLTVYIATGVGKDDRP